MTAWLESDDPARTRRSPNSSSVRSARVVRGAGGDFVVGMMVLAGALLEDLSACTERDSSALLQDLALRYV